MSFLKVLFGLICILLLYNVYTFFSVLLSGNTFSLEHFSNCVILLISITLLILQFLEDKQRRHE